MQKNVLRVRVGGGMRYLRTEKLRSFYLRPFIVLGLGLKISALKHEQAVLIH